MPTFKSCLLRRTTKNRLTGAAWWLHGKKEEKVLCLELKNVIKHKDELKFGTHLSEFKTLNN